MFVIFYIIALSVLSGMYWFIGWRLIVPAGFDLFWNVILWSVIAAFMLLLPPTMVLRSYGFKGQFNDFLLWAAYLSFGFFILLFSILLFRDITFLSYTLLKKLSLITVSFFNADSGINNPFDPVRRYFLSNITNICLIGLAGIFAVFGFFEAKKTPKVVNVYIPVPQLSKNPGGFRIVQITDLHIDPIKSTSFVQNVITKVNSLSPDIIAITGDLADGTFEDYRDKAILLKGLKSKYGSYFVTGNHEYFSNVNDWLENLEKLGIKTLLNEHVVIEHEGFNILLAGVTDYEGGRFVKEHMSSPEKALKNAKPADYKILLAHQPKSIFQASKAGFDLQISGHTHGGQFIPWKYLVRLQQPYLSGLHKHENTWIYTSRGTGFWGPPVRIAAPSEITLITLTEESTDNR
jgi:predicted MPP superfamily phosphohydrolase